MVIVSKNRYESLDFSILLKNETNSIYKQKFRSKRWKNIVFESLEVD